MAGCYWKMESPVYHGVGVPQDLFPELYWTGQGGLGGLAQLPPASTVQSNMASSEVTEVLGYSEEIVGDDMIEINNDTLDMPVECVQEVVTDSNFHFGDHQIIYGDELIVTSEDVPQSEEIVDNDSDPYVGLYESVPVPASTSDVLDSSNLRSFVSKPQKQKEKKLKREQFDLESLADGRIRQTGSWQQKQVSIKTLEGEFSVTMWASGADEG